MKKLMAALLFLISFSSFSQTYTYDRNALTLANKVAGCGDIFSTLIESGFSIISANIDKTTMTIDQYPNLESEAVTSVLLGKGYQPMLGYSEFKKLIIESTKKCIGNPAADGKCTEIVNSCYLE